MEERKGKKKKWKQKKLKGDKVTCDLRHVRNIESVGVVSGSRQTVGHIGALEEERRVVPVQTVGKPAHAK